MNAATDAWNSMGYVEGFMFTLWIIALYYIKCRIDTTFAKKRKKFWKGSIKESVKEALEEWESGIEYLCTPTDAKGRYYCSKSNCEGVRFDLKE